MIKNKHISGKSGFTIVELLIVIIVIAILATIGFVQYTGMQDRAREAVLRSDLTSAAEILNIDQVRTGSYPEEKDEADRGNGLPASDGTVYYYTVYNSVDPVEFCLTGHNGAIALFITHEGVIGEGACEGHPEPSVHDDTEGSDIAIDEDLPVKEGIIGYIDEVGEVELSRPLTGEPEITMYSVYQADAPFDPPSPFAYLSPSYDGHRFQMEPGPSMFNNGVDPSDGYNMSYQGMACTLATAASPNRHQLQPGGYRSPFGRRMVGVLRLSNDAKVQQCGYWTGSGGSMGTQSYGYSPTQWHFTSLTLDSDHNGVGIVAIVYNVAHDSATEQQIINYLRAKYNISP